MRHGRITAILIVGMILMGWSAGLSVAEPLGTAFTYQGRLIDANSAADGLYDFQFKLFDDANIVLGNQVGGDVNIPELDVIDGYFAAALDFGGGVFDGNAVWLEVGVRPGDQNDPNGYTVLLPRLEIAVVPYALQTRGIFVDNAGNIGIGTTSPSERLKVIGTVKSTGGFATGDTTTLQNGWIRVYGLTPNDLIFKVGGIGPPASATQGTEIMRLTETGRLGIGTTNPTEKLEVNGMVKATAFVGDGSGLTGITTTETDPTVLSSVKDGITWSEVSNRPAGLDDGDQVGITTETDPTVLASVKDGVSWSEVSNIPPGFADGIDDVGGVGDITTVYAGTGLTGGGTSGDVTLAFSTSWGDSRYLNLSTDQTVGGTKTFSNQTRFTYGIYVPDPGASGSAVYVYNNGSSPTIWGKANQSTNTIYVTNSSDYYPTIWARNTNSNGANCIYAQNNNSSTYATIYAKNDSGGWAGWFEGDLGSSGSKSAAVETQNYGRRSLYADESAEVYFFDRGSGQLTTGTCVINLDPIFLETVTINETHPMLVQVTLTGDCRGVFVSEKTNNTFTIRELQGGTSRATFDWEVAASRKGYEGVRMEKITIVKDPQVETVGVGIEGVCSPSGGVRVIRGE